MNVAARFGTGQRRAASPYARRLARERDIALENLVGSGPNDRIVAADILAYNVSVEDKPPERPTLAPASSTFIFSATASLVDLYLLAAETERVGLTIDVKDAAHRAARTALTFVGYAGDADKAGIALEADDRQILVSTGGGLSVGTERKLRLAAQESGVDVSKDPALMSLRVLHASRVVPASMPLLPGRKLRLVLVVDEAKEQANALLCAKASEMTETLALEMLEAIVIALEKPLALMA